MEPSPSQAHLLGVKGVVKNRRLVFMLDSGASCNFVSLDLIRTLGLVQQIARNVSDVRLANGKVLQTVGLLYLEIHFEDYRYCAPFYVMDCDVPLILGISFFTRCEPFISWEQRRVFLKDHDHYVELQTTNIDNLAVQTTTKQPVGAFDSSFVKISNSFDGLEEEPYCSATDSCQPDPIVQMQSTDGHCGVKRVCGICARVLGMEIAGDVCQKCKNHSFVHQQRDQVSVPNECSSKNVQVPRGSDVSMTNMELVSLKQFVRGGKRNQYLHFGVIQLHDDGNDCKEVQSLNFTHRTAHGGDGDAISSHGDLQQLASEQLSVLKQKYACVFKDPVYPVDRSDCPSEFFHSIPLKDENAAPPKRKLYPLDNVELEELKKQIGEFLKSNRIEPSSGAYGAPILFAKKKDGGLRMCIDYRMLNGQTKDDIFPLPRIDGLLQCLDGAEVFSKLDLRDGYHQISMSPSDKAKTAFTCRYGSFQFTVMPFGLASAPATFQRMMNHVFFDLLDHGVLCYLDDLLIYSRTVEEHKILLDKVFSLLAKYRLYIKESKCHLFLQQVNFLGHVVSKEGVSLEPGKVDAVRKWPQPLNVNQVQQFLGLCNYYRRFVLRFSEIAGPLSQLTRKDQQFEFGEQQKVAFQRLKDCLCTAPVLKVFDPQLPTRVVCDASNYCVGAVLEQKHMDAKWHPVEFYSKRLNSAERNYSATEREFVAIRLALERWRQFLMGIHFKLLTDHAALTYLQTTANVSRRNARWLDFLSQFKFDIEHIKGRENVVADSLSRIPGTETLSALFLCSVFYTLGVQHCADVPAKLQKCQQVFCNSFLTIHENESFLKAIKNEQQACSDAWYVKLVEQAKLGSIQYQFRDGILCKLVRDTFCPVIPSQQSRSVQIILHDLHSSALAGHFGVKKLYKLASTRFYWQNMYKCCEQFVKNCSVCQQNKTSTQKPHGFLQPVENPARPFDHVTMDFVMQLPDSYGYDAIFSIVDRFSRYVRFIPCKTTITAAETAQLFFDQWICRYGMPSKIVSDRDTRFQSNFWQSLMKQLQCRIAMSTAYHPQSDGLTERYHRSVEQVLRCYCSSQQSEWSRLLSQCEFALNASVQDSTGSVPFTVLYGSVPVLPLDIQLSGLQPPAVVDFVSQRNTIQAQVQANLELAKDAMKVTADRRRRGVELLAGQKVWLATANLPLKLGTRKLSPKFIGPFELESEVSPAAWRLKLPASFGIHNVFHVSQLKAVVGDVPSFDQEPVQLEETEEFEVQEILRSKFVRNREYFLVRWRGYSPFEDSWEPLENLENCPEVLARFRNKLK